MALGLALLGTGRIVESGYIPAMKHIPNARMAAVLSRDQDRADAFAEKHGIAKGYSDIDALLKDPAVDAVIVATPDGTHEEQVIAAARAGKAILCEKPLSTDLASCERMAEAVRKAGILFAMGYDHRFMQGQRKIKSLIDEGAIGNVRYTHAYVTTFVSDPTSWRAAGDQSTFWAMSATGTHVIDIYRWFFGEPARVGGGMVSPVHGSAKDEIAIILLDYPGRLIAEMTVAAVLPHSSRLELHGDKGSIIAQNVFGRVNLEATITVNGERLTVQQTDPFISEVKDFVEAIEQGRPAEVSLEDGIRNVHIMDVARASTLLHPI